MVQTVPSLNWLRVFEAAARFQSFARAATELNMSAAAVSQQIRALEERLGTPLFDRHAHSVTLTDIGQTYLPAVQQALVSLQEATDGIFGSANRQSLVIQAVPLFTQGVLAKACAQFALLHPQIDITLTSTFSPADMAGRYHDLRVVFGAPSQAEGSTERLLGERLYPVATPAIAAQITEPADLLTHPLVEVAAHRAGWPYLFEKLGFVTRAARYIYTDDTIMAAAIASEGAGIALARAPASDKAVEEAGLVPCLDGFSVEGALSYHLVSPDHINLRRPAQLFREWLMGYCASL